MTHLSFSPRRPALAVLMTLALCAQAAPALAAPALEAALSGAAEVPAVSSAAIGHAEISLNPDTRVLSWTVTHSGLSGLVTGAHFHGPALAGKNAGVLVPITGSLLSPISGSATITIAQVAQVMAGQWYINLHTAANPGGEIRGQVMVRP